MRKIIFFVLAILSAPVLSTTICDGMVARVQLTREGNVEVISSQLYGNSDGRTVCNIHAEWKGVKPESCRGWYSLMLSSVAMKSKIRVQYSAGQTCAGQPSWSAANAPWMLSNI